MMSSSSSSNVITNLNSNSILVAMRQKNNPILRDINNVKYEFYPNLIPDFVINQKTCCYFLSLKYHQLQ